MANICCVDIDIDYFSEDDAERARQKLEADIKALGDDTGYLLNPERRCLFDADVQRTGSTVSVGCWVKWCMQPADFFGWLHSLEAFGEVRRMHADYSEPGDLAYGYYEYTSDKPSECTHRYLSDADYPDEGWYGCPDEGWHDYEELEHLLDEKGITETIKDKE